MRKDNQAGRHQENLLYDLVFKARQWRKVPQAELSIVGHCASQSKQYLLLNYIHIDLYIGLILTEYNSRISNL